MLKSGMILQFDIIPSVEGYAGVSCEGGIALADAGLQEKIKHSYPEKYEAFMKRREYMRKILGIIYAVDESAGGRKGRHMI